MYRRHQRKRPRRLEYMDRPSGHGGSHHALPSQAGRCDQAGAPSMTLLDRFRTQTGHKHPDPAVRLAYVAELPLDDREMIAAIAREDEDPRVRRAAVAKLMDAGALGIIARTDSDEGVRSAASTMLRDLALEAFEGTA